MNKLRRWIINKLGGFTIDNVKFKEVVDGYWDKEFIRATLYISPSDYTKENAESIEQELTRLLSVELLKRGCVMFNGPYKDHDDLRIEALCNALRIHRRTSYNFPDHLIFEKEKE